MKDTETDLHLQRHLSGQAAPEALRQEVLRASTAEFGRAVRRRRLWQRVAAAAAAILIAGAAFFGGQLSVRPQLAAGGKDSVVKTEGVTVPRELVTWLEAARFFGQLGMQDRMARAVERAGRLLPVDAVAGDGAGAETALACGSNETQQELAERTDRSGPNPSAGSVQPILAHSLGD